MRESEVVAFIKEFVASYKAQTRWGEPVVGFASADDPLFFSLKDVATPTHALPLDLLKGAKTVVCYFIPFDVSIPESNRGPGNSSKEWAVAYIETNQLILGLNQALSKMLAELGYACAVLPATHNFDEKTLVSEWSHKHAAFIAGLGRFGLHHMLITKKGCCGRLGSLITTAPLKPTPRPAGEFCLFKHDGSCKACVARCGWGALTENGLGKHACYAVCLKNADVHKELGLADVCGKCACGVPCSLSNPVKARTRR